MKGYFSIKATTLGANLFMLEDREKGELDTLLECRGS